MKRYVSGKLQGSYEDRECERSTASAFTYGCSYEQRHVHEVQGNVMIAGPTDDPHNHRFSTITGQAILTNNGRDHFHEVEFRTDFYEDHFHRFRGRTSGAIDVGDRHVHYIDDAETTLNDGHRHEFRLVTMLDDPIGE